MKNIYSLIIIALIISINAHAQNPTFTWAKQFSGLNDQQGYSVAVDASGNVITVGEFGDVTDFDPGAGTFTLNPGSNYDVFISKLDASGNFVWAKQIGMNSTLEQAYDVVIDASGNIYFTGAFYSTTDFDPGAGVFNMTAPNNQADVFICKLNSAGNFVWAKQFGSTLTDIAFSIALDQSNNVHTTGYFSGTVDFDPGVGVSNMTSSGPTDIFVSKLDVSGNFVWAKQFAGGGTNFSAGRGISVDVSGNVYTTGHFAGTIDFDPGAGIFNMTHSNSQDAFISKLDISGNFVWAKQFNGSGPAGAFGKDIVVDANNVYTVGYFTGTGDFDPGIGTFTLASSGPSGDVFVSKLNNAGNFVWAKSFTGNGDDRGNGIALDLSGNIYIAGSFQATTDFDPGAGTFNLTPSSNNGVFTSKLNASGNYVWAGQFIGTAGYGGVANAIVVDAANNFYTTGTFSATMDFDAGAGTSNMTSLGGFDVFTTKYNGCPTTSQPGAISGQTSLCNGAGSTTYSIATVVGATSYSWSLPGGWSGSSSTNTIAATPGSTGIFTVTANNACGASPQQTLAVTIHPLPTINASTTASILCIGQSATLSASGASTYTWNPGGPGASITISPTLNTTYTVIGTSSLNCSNSTLFTQTVTSCTGINQLSNSVNEITVYPNPFNNKITIATNGGIQTVQIFNPLGSLVYQTEIENEKTEISLEKENSGIYFIKIGTGIKKIIKE